jgi:hypothetical protein
MRRFVPFTTSPGVNRQLERVDWLESREDNDLVAFFLPTESCEGREACELNLSEKKNATPTGRQAGRQAGL